MKAEESQLYEKNVQLKLISLDDKRYNSDVADTEQLLRIIGFRQSRLGKARRGIVHYNRRHAW